MVRKFAQLQEQYLAGAGAGIGDTTVILKSLKQINGTNITDMSAVFGSKALGTIEPGKGNREEQISFTGIISNADGTVSITGVSSVSMVYPYTETAGLTKQHAGGVVFVISNTSAFYSEFIVAGDDYDINGTFTFKTQPKIDIDVDLDGHPDDPVNEKDIPTKYYVDKKKQEVVDQLPLYLQKAGGIMSGTIDTNGNKITGLPLPTSSDLTEPATVAYANNLSYAGAPDASETVKGLVEIATTAQVLAGVDVGETGAKIVPKPSDVLKIGIDYNSSKTYSEGEVALFNGRFYKSLQDSNTTSPEDFTREAIDLTTFNYTHGNTSSKYSVYSKIKFYNNGMLALAGSGSNKITGYVLEKAYVADSSTSQYDYTLTRSGLVAFDLSSDGTKLITQVSSLQVQIYTLSTAFDLSTATFSEERSLYNESYIKDIDIVSSTKIHFLYNYSSTHTINELTLTTPWSFVGSSETNSWATNSFDTDPRAFNYNNDGTQIYLSGISTDRLNTATLSTPYNISTAGAISFISIQNFKSTEGAYHTYESGSVIVVHSPLTSNYAGVYERKISLWKPAISFGDIQTLSYWTDSYNYIYRIPVNEYGILILYIAGDDISMSVTLNGTEVGRYVDDSSGTNNGLTITLPVAPSDVITFDARNSSTPMTILFRPFNL